MLVESRKSRLLKENTYTESHHIVPISERGKDVFSNLIELTPREHYIAHLLLAKIYNDQAMLNAVLAFRTRKGAGIDLRLNSRLFQALRVQMATRFSKRNAGKNNPMYGRKLKDCMTPEKYEKWRKTRTGCTQWNNGVREIFVKVGKEPPPGFVKGRLPSAVRKMSERQKGRRHSPEAAKKMVETKRRNGTLKRSRESIEKQMRTRRERGLTYDTARGSNWYTDGKISVRFRPGEDIPNGFRLGRIYNSMWITDGKISKHIRKTDPIPDGWRHGRTHVRRSN